MTGYIFGVVVDFSADEAEALIKNLQKVALNKQLSAETEAEFEEAEALIQAGRKVANALKETREHAA